VASAEGTRQSPSGQKVFIPAGSGGIGTFAISWPSSWCQGRNDTSTGNVELVRSLGADEVVDYKKQEFETVLRGYDAVLGTVRVTRSRRSDRHPQGGEQRSSPGRAAGRSIRRARRLNFVLTFVFGLMSRKIMRLAKSGTVTYSFLFARPDGDQLAEIGELLKAQRIRPVIDKVFRSSKQRMRWHTSPRGAPRARSSCR
jgi:NADPH:quinone reductase-like Zn-dependent oxidoreductase